MAWPPWKRLGQLGACDRPPALKADAGKTTAPDRPSIHGLGRLEAGCQKAAHPLLRWDGRGAQSARREAGTCEKRRSEVEPAGIVAQVKVDIAEAHARSCDSLVLRRATSRRLITNIPGSDWASAPFRSRGFGACRPIRLVMYMLRQSGIAEDAILLEGGVEGRAHGKPVA
eukprot:scaffold12447_cov111-Isochrysis_galbana.AAC.2